MQEQIECNENISDVSFSNSCIKRYHPYQTYLFNFIEKLNFAEENNSDTLNLTLQMGLLMIGFFTFFALFFIPAYYGRHNNRKRCLMFSDTLAWMFQESPCIYVTIYFIYVFLQQEKMSCDLFDIYKIFLLILFIIHYIHRSFIFPFKLKSKTNERKMPIEISLMAFAFCIWNSIIQCRSILFFSDLKTINEHNFFFFLYRNSIRIISGFFLFLLGMWLNITHDYHVLNKKKSLSEGSGGYFIPEYFLFQYVSCPNYLGEIIEWVGFALMANTFSAWLFVFFTVSNLLPRAIAHHKWYKNKFVDYPMQRKALFPFLL